MSAHWPCGTTVRLGLTMFSLPDRSDIDEHDRLAATQKKKN